MSDSTNKVIESIALTLSEPANRFSVVIGHKVLAETVDIDWIVPLTYLASSEAIDSIIVTDSGQRMKAILATVSATAFGLSELSEVGRNEKRIFFVSNVDTAIDAQDKLVRYFSRHGLLVFDLDPTGDSVIFKCLIDSAEGFWTKYYFTESSFSKEFTDQLATAPIVPVRVQNTRHTFSEITSRLQQSKPQTRPIDGTRPPVVPTGSPVEIHLDNGDYAAINVLAIDGGGIRGVIPAVILSELEAKTGKRINDLFDVIVGTSTGGIIAMGLTCPGTGNQPKYTADELAKLYLNHGTTIFPEKLSRLHWLGVLASLLCKPVPKLSKMVEKGLKEPYAAAGLESVMKKFFGESRMSELLNEVFITTYELESRNVRLLSRQLALADGRRDMKLVDVARATSAAPSYFKPFRLTQDNALPNELSFIDGGVFANNPAICAYVEARRLHGPNREIVIVSLGTGEDPPPLYGKLAVNWLSGHWIEHLVDILMHGNSQITDKNLDRLLAQIPGTKRTYYRFQPKLTNCEKSLDAASKSNIERLATIAKNHIENERHHDFDELVAHLI